MNHARALASFVFAGCTALALPVRAVAGTLTHVTFTATSPLSSNAELARRMLSPLKNAALANLIAKGAKLAEQPVDPAKETFVLYVPSRAPAGGYGLVVFVPPWDVARLPDGWGPVLDQAGMIFVSAAKSGNDQNVLARREPLALLGQTNVAQRYRLDPTRIYVAGFSGGSRVALRLALGYPDVFRGAILDAGSDAIGTATIPLPPRDLLARFQETSHIVYLTGDRDTAAVAADAASLHSLNDWCVFGVDERSAMNEGHDAMGGTALAVALDLLAKPAASDAAKLASCRTDIESAINAKLASARALLASGKRDAARQLLLNIDAQYGGLAAPASVELAKAVGIP
ncbi:MAG TPA: PHB depolymerase family esterase [Rhizomicrobium sp.]|jgi:hypothetical protein